MGFSKDFVWGAATSAHQVEGAYLEDGKGLDLWDVYEQEAGHVYEGHTGHVSCDHYHRYKEDVSLMKEIGLQAYRFSINWARIMPEGVGSINQKGIDFYKRLLDELNQAGIEPYLTLFHWEMPYALYQKGGWMNPDIVNWFGEYAAVVSKEFSPMVKNYFTLNEPQCFIGLGYQNGQHAPGLHLMNKDLFQMAHNVMKAHGAAVLQLRANASQPIQIGYAPTCGVFYPASEKEADVEAARKKLFECPDLENWTWNVSWWSDPVMLGTYPEDGLKKYEPYLPNITQDDLKLMHQPLDFYGQNIYNGKMVKADENGNPVIVKRYPGFPKTAIQWPVTPECLRWGAKFLYERYQKPFYITENGQSCQDVISLDGNVHDPQRIDFTHRYLRELKRAAEEGADIKGYFHWSFMDNFEWACGYSERFGMVYVDYPTQKRIIKDSGYWYRNVIQTNGENL